MLNKLECIQLLKQDVIPALGCTEPVCVALCLANASKVLDEEILSIECDVNIGIFKNGMSAGIPNFEDVGLRYAATLGAFLKNPEKGLKLFEDIDDEIKNKVYKFKDTQIHVDSSQTVLYVKGTIHTQNQTSTCIIKNEHTNVVYVSKNNEVLLDYENTVSNQSNLIQNLKEMSISDIVDLVDELDVDDIEFLYEGVKMNLKLADYAKDHNLPLSSFWMSIKYDVKFRCRNEGYCANLTNSYCCERSTYIERKRIKGFSFRSSFKSLHQFLYWKIITYVYLCHG